MWFKELMGFTEESPEQVKANIDVSGNRLISKVSHAEYVYGWLEVFSLELFLKLMFFLLLGCYSNNNYNSL